MFSEKGLKIFHPCIFSKTIKLFYFPIEYHGNFHPDEKSSFWRGNKIGKVVK